MNGDLTIETSLLEQTLQLLCDCSDLSHLHLPLLQIDIIYFGHLVSTEALRKDALEPFNHKDADMVAILSQSSYIPKLQASELVTGILAGSIAIYYRNRAYLYKAYAPESRSIQNSETESAINGPMDSFTESLNTNLSLIRRRIKNSGLKAITFTIGTRTETTMILLYLDELADPLHVQQLSEMVEKLEIQTIYDTNTLVQYLSTDKLSIFPQFLTSVRPDLISDKLTSGKVIG
ncbi:spore germination protein, partial [Paenibacillus sp. TAF58]